jgi:hypothetical protein
VVVVGVSKASDSHQCCVLMFVQINDWVEIFSDSS